MGSEIGEELEFYYFSGIAGQTWEYKVTDEADVVVKTADMVATGTIVGMYRGTYTPDAKGVWNFAIALAKFGQSFHVGMGQEEIIQNIVEAGGTGDLAAILLDTGTTLPNLLAAIAAYLDTEIAAILEDVTGINGDAMRGTDSAALAASWTAALATALAAYTAARGAFLDELDFALQEAIAALQTDLDSPAQYKADVSALALEVTVADLITRAKGLDSIYDLLDAILDLTETGGTLTSTGAEDNIYFVNAPSGVWEPRHCLIDLTNMAGVDEITIRIYYRIKSGGNLILHYAESYGPGAESVPLWEQELIPNRYGVLVTLEKTAGVNRDYDWEVLYNG